MTQDIFDSKILCKECNSQMRKSELFKNGFKMRVMVCPKCNGKLNHPLDKSEYNKFINLKNKEFQVKMRMVGNSYAVSIPREIVYFMNEQKRKMNEMVRLCFEDMGRVSLNFNQSNLKTNSNTRIIKAREVKILNDGKLIHAKQFSDSAHPERNKTIVKKRKIQNGR